jgi:peptidoglycan/LPS O-acetylase OafA/YrhL
MGVVRVALALAVVLSHLPPATFHFIGGGLAVQGFFIISGFYMALVLSGKYASTGLFYSNRLLRLMPGYFAMMAIAAFTLFVLGASVTITPEMLSAAYRRQDVGSFLIFENIAVVGQEMLYWFKTQADGTLALDLLGRPETEQEGLAFRAMLLPQAWSLSMELVFYLFAPLLVRARWSTLLWLAAASIALRFAGYLLPVDYGLWQGRFFPTALFLFIFGILAHRALPLAQRLPKIVGWLFNAALLATIIALPLAKLPGEASRWIVYGAIALALPFVFNASKNFAADRWLGDLSYPIYLTHLVVIGFVLTFEVPLAMWTALAATLALSIVMLLLIDEPIDRWRQRRLARVKEPLAEPVAA